jgi:PKD repeat protein
MSGMKRSVIALCLWTMLSGFAFAATSHPWTDVSSLTVHFRITGSSIVGSAVHKVVLTVNTNNHAASSFRIYGPGIDSGNISSLPYTMDYTLPAPGKLNYLEDLGSGIYRLTLEQKPVGIGGGTIGSDESWSLFLSGMSTPNTIDVTILAQNRTTGDATTLVSLNVPPVSNIAPTSASVVRGHTVSWTGSATDEDPASVTYTWTFGGGTPATGTGAGPHVVTYSTVGGYTTGLTVQDNVGQQGTKTAGVTVSANNAPVATITDPATATITIGLGQTVSFSGSVTDEYPASVTYGWTFAGGSPSSVSGAGPHVITYSTAGGPYEARLTVTDDVSQTGSDAVSVTVNAAPVASILPTSVIVVRGHTVSWTGSATDEDPASVTYTWTFGGGTPASGTGAGPHVVTYSTVGGYTTALTVQDNVGQQGTKTAPVTVNQNNAPVATITDPATATITIGLGQTVSFSGSVTDEYPASVTYGWTFAGGSPSSVSGAGPHVITYSTAGGPYEARLTVTDDVSQTGSDTVSVTVSASNQSPTAECSPSPATGTAPVQVTFSSAGSGDTEGPITYVWDFGDGGDSTEANPVHEYDEEGVYEVTLTVTDDDGATDVATTEVVVYPNPNFLLVFPSHRGVPYNPNPPTIDGSVAPDVGWRGAFRITYEGGTEPIAAMQGLRHRSENYLYLSFEIGSDMTLDQGDLIVLHFRPDAATASAANDRRIFIHAFGATPVPGTDNAPPDSVRVWRDSSAWVEFSQSDVAGFGFDIKVSSKELAGTYSWNVEIRLPTSKATGGTSWVDFANTFLFAAHAIRTSTSGSEPGQLQFCWPRGAPWASGLIETFAFAPAWWVRADRSGTAGTNGVFFKDYGDVGTTNVPQSDIKLPTETTRIVTNTFQASVRNATRRETTGGAVYDSVPDVRVKFRIANWGLPGFGDWTDVPTPTNPTGLQPLPPGSDTGESVTPFSSDWTLSWDVPADRDRANGYQPPNDHQCMLAEIDAAQANILTKSVHRNMDFVNASRFSRVATVGTKGYGIPADGEASHSIRIAVSEMEMPSQEKKGASRYLWIANGFLADDDSVIIRGTRYHRLTPIGSFGYLAQHDGPVEQWVYTIAGAKRIGENLFALEVAPGKSARVTTTLIPCEMALTGQLSIHSGIAVPLGGFAPACVPGPAFVLDAGYRFAQCLTALFVAGASFFPSSPAGQDTYWLNANAVLRLDLLAAGSTYLYADAGAGAYLPKGGPVDLGGNLGIGVDWKVNRHLTVEIGSEAHATLTSGARFVQALLGAIWRF